MTTSQNVHVDAAENWSGLEEAGRQIEATLAVAYEARTANMIALLTLSNPDGSRVVDKQPAIETMKTIIERLGLE